MKDWKAIAKLTIPDLAEADIDRLIGPLAALEESFRPLVRALTPDQEPAICFYLEKESE
jgi:hypothetical protein